MILKIILLIVFVIVLIFFSLYFTLAWAFEKFEEECAKNDFDDNNRWFHGK